MTKPTQTFDSTFEKAINLFFGHNPKYPLWILVALYLRKKGTLRIVENPINLKKEDNLIWDWNDGADLSYAQQFFNNEINTQWAKNGIKSLTIVGEVSSDSELIEIVKAFKKASTAESTTSPLFNPQWEPSFLLEVVSLLLSIDDDWFSYDYKTNVDDIIYRIFAKSQFRGQFVQPKELTSLALSLLCRNSNHYYPDKIYNPCCGIGSYITAGIPFDYHFGEEIDPVIAAIAQFRIKWFDLNYASVRCVDSTKSDFENYNGLISTPPFNGGRNGYPNFAEIFIDKCLEKKIPGVLVLPASFTFDNKYKNLREKLINTDSLEGIISLPVDVFYPYTNITTVIVVIDPNKVDNKGKVIFVDATTFIDEKTKVISQESIEEAWKEPNINKVIIDNETVAKAEYSLSVGNYIGLNIPVPNGAKIYKLDDIGRFIEDFTSNILEDVPWATLSSFNNVNLIKGYSPQEIAIGKTMPHALKLVSDCVLISAAGARGIYLTMDNENPVYTHRNNVGFIPNSDIILPQYLILELTKSYIVKRTAGWSPSSFSKNIKELKIIVPSIEEQKNAISKYHDSLINQLGVKVSLLKTRRDEEQRRELETRKHRIGQILNDALPAFENLYSFIENSKSSITKDTIIDELFNTSLIEELSGIRSGLKKASKLLKSLTDEVTFSKEENIDFCNFIAENSKELKPTKYDVRWLGGVFQENEHPIIRFSDNDLKIIFENIFSNAIKYGFTDKSRSDYFISVNFNCQNIDGKPFLQILISNNGSPLANGMNPERVFEWGKGQGNGIGGWQMRNIIEHFDGSITFEEMNKNPEGMTVRYVIHIPLIENPNE